MTIIKYGMLIIINSLLFVTICFADNSKISVHYNERIPYLISTHQGVKGLTGTPVALAFIKANITFSDIPDGEKRYILCSNKVGDEVINKLNKSIGDF